MGVRKLKWTAEEEEALRNGIIKHGVGKWSDILKDHEFRSVLRARSNVDLKDKWRNMHLAMIGESRNSCKPVENKIKKTSRRCDISEGCDEDKLAEPEPPSSFNEASQKAGSEKLTRCKLEGLTNAKQPSSSTQIQEPLQPPNLERFWSENIKSVTVHGKLIEVQQRMEYGLADSNILRAEVDDELMRIMKMSPEDAVAAAVAAAVEAVKKAEAAIAEAEEAEKEAVEAESAAEKANAFAENLRKELREKKARPAPKRGKRGCIKC